MGTQDRRRRLLPLSLLLLFLAWASLAQTTGRIEGIARDDTGNGLPGVEITAEGPALPRSQTAITGKDGRFRFPALPPGEYRLQAELEGYPAAQLEAVRVSLDRTVTVTISLPTVFAEELTVVSEAPLIDATKTTTGASFSTEMLEVLPTTRDYQAITFAAAGTGSGGLPNNPSVRGASAAENRYLVDGLDVTDPGFGIVESFLPFELVDAVEIKTGGYQAEYGGALGGIVNVITRSGGNELRGSIFAYYSDDRLQSTSPPVEQYGQRLGRETLDYGVSISGSLVRDELWAFAALNPTREDERITNLGGTPFTESEERSRHAAKLTWQASATQRLVASTFGDPGSWDDVPLLPAIGRIFQNEELGATNYALNYSATPSSSLLVEASVGHHERRSSFTPTVEASPAYNDLTENRAWAQGAGCDAQGPLEGGDLLVFTPDCEGGFFVWETGDRSRSQARGAASWLLGEHELKGGLEARRTDYRSRSRYPAPYPLPLVDEEGTVVEADGLSGGFFELHDGFYILSEISNNAVGEGDELALFVQDRWQVSRRLTLDLGVRLDSLDLTGVASLENPDRALDFDLDEMIAPRLGLIFTPDRRARTKLYASYARYYESVPLDLAVRAFGRESASFHLFLYPSDGSLPRYTNLGLHLVSVGFGLDVAVGPGVDPMFTEEAVLGFERQLLPTLAVGLRAVYREVRDVVEDISVDGGETYFFTNPGGTYTHNPVTGAPLPSSVVFPRAQREYRALELTVERRLADRWQLHGSWVVSENEGNYGGLYRQENFQLDPNLTSQFDLPSLLDGAFGPLPNDRPHQLKVYGSYAFPFGLTTGLFAEYASGTPISKLGAHLFYGARERFIEPRGRAGRTPAIWHADLHLGYSLPLSGRFGVELVADVFNLTDEQEPTLVDESWTFAPLERTEDPNECGGPGTGPGTSCPAGNPLFGTPLVYQSPREVRVGVKLRW